MPDPITNFVLRVIAKKISSTIYRTAEAWWNLDSQMPKVDRSYNQVRSELEEVGLLYYPVDENDGGYLEQIEVVIASMPSSGEAGFVYDHLPWHWRLLGYEEGVIYLPSDLPSEAYVPGGTLTDTIRHEYAHAWHWLEPSFVNDNWFHKAFGGGYEESGTTPLELWEAKLDSSRTFLQQLEPLPQ